MTIAQSEESCVVYGMPKAAIERGYAMRVVQLGRAADHFASAVRPRRRPGERRGAKAFAQAVSGMNSVVVGRSLEL